MGPFGAPIILVITALLSFARPAMAWTAAQYAADPLGSYLNEIKANKWVTFVSDCQLDDHSKAIMIVRPNFPLGQFYAIYDKAANGGAIVSIEGRVNIGQPAPQVIWTEGVTTPDLRKKLGMSLMNQPFRLMLASRIDEIFQKPANQVC